MIFEGLRQVLKHRMETVGEALRVSSRVTEKCAAKSDAPTFEDLCEAVNLA